LGVASSLSHAVLISRQRRRNGRGVVETHLLPLADLNRVDLIGCGEFGDGPGLLGGLQDDLGLERGQITPACTGHETPRDGSGTFDQFNIPSCPENRDHLNDQDGNRTGLTDSQGGLTSYVYDARDNLATLTQSGTGVNSKRVDFIYDGLGDLTSETRYSDLTGTNKVVTTTYGYDVAERLTGITDKTSSGTVVASYAYTLDEANRLTQETQTWQGTGTTSDTTNYTYTNNNQLTGVTHTDTAFANETFSFDSNGNRDMSGYATGTDNQITSDGTYKYTYDNEGNLITKTDIATGAQTQYTYDFRNRLTEVDQIVSGVTTVLATYTYDALDRRIGVSEGGATTWTLYDGTSTNPLMDFNGSGSLTVRYLDGPSVTGVDAVLSRDTPSSGVAWYLSDRLGSVGDIVNNSGAVIDHIAYSAFGQILSESNATAGDRFKYACMQYDAITGLDYDQARWYSPGLGRFMSQDPTGFAAGDANLYRYVGNNPANATDSTGLRRDWTNPGIIIIDPSGNLPDPCQALVKNEDSNKLFYLPKKGTQNEADGLFTKDGVLKIPDDTIVTVKFNQDGTYTYTVKYTGTYYPILKGPSPWWPYGGKVNIPLPTPAPSKTGPGEGNPFDIDNPLDPTGPKSC